MAGSNYGVNGLTDADLYNNYMNRNKNTTTGKNADDSSSLNTTNGVSTGASKPQTKTTGNSDLGKEAFLQLLVTQMQYQDPLDPQDNSEYIAQLANFSSLEQMTNLNDKMAELGVLIDNIDSSTLIGQTSNFIGKEIEWKNDKGEMQTGTVTGIKIVEGKPLILVGDIIVTLGQIHGVGKIPSDTTNPPSDGSDDNKGDTPSDGSGDKTDKKV